MLSRFQKLGLQSTKGLLRAHGHHCAKPWNASAVRLFAADGAPKMQRKSGYDEHEHDSVHSTDAKKEFDAADRGQKEARQATEKSQAEIAKQRAQQREEELNRVEKASIADQHGLEAAQINPHEMQQPAKSGDPNGATNAASASTTMTRDAKDYMDVAKDNARNTAKAGQVGKQIDSSNPTGDKRWSDELNERVQQQASGEHGMDPKKMDSAEKAGGMNNIKKAAVGGELSGNEALEKAKEAANKVYDDAAKGIRTPRTEAAGTMEYGDSSQMSPNRSDYTDIALEKGREAAEIGKEKASEMKDSMKSTASQAYGSAKNTASDMKEQAKHTYEAAKDRANDTYDSITDSAKQAYNNAKEQSRSASSEATYAKDRATSKAQDAFDSARTQADVTYDKLRDSANQSMHSAKGAAKETYDDARSKAREARDEFNRQANESGSTFEAAKEKTSEAFDKMREKAASAYETVKEKVQDAYEAVKPKSDKDKF